MLGWVSSHPFGRAFQLSEQRLEVRRVRVIETHHIEVSHADAPDAGSELDGRLVHIVVVFAQPRSVIWLAVFPLAPKIAPNEATEFDKQFVWVLLIPIVPWTIIVGIPAATHGKCPQKRDAPFGKLFGPFGKLFGVAGRDLVLF